MGARLGVKRNQGLLFVATLALNDLGEGGQLELLVLSIHVGVVVGSRLQSRLHRLHELRLAACELATTVRSVVLYARIKDFFYV